MSHEIGEIWKTDNGWNVKMPRGIWNTATKKRALLIAASIKPVPWRIGLWARYKGAIYCPRNAAALLAINTDFATCAQGTGPGFCGVDHDHDSCDRRD